METYQTITEDFLRKTFEKTTNREDLTFLISTVLSSIPKSQVDYICSLYSRKLISKDLAIKELIQYQ